MKIITGVRMRKHGNTDNDKNNDISVFCNKNNIDLISINTSKGYLEPLIDFFNYRMQKY